MPQQRVFQPGDIIAGRYRLVAELATGGMGAVYTAIQLGLDRTVAIKLLKPKLAMNDDVRVRFVREAKVASRFKHPGSVEIYDFGEDEGVPYLVMELLDGMTMGTYLEHAGRLTVQETAEFGLSLATTLAAAHKIPLVHRDIKPDNVFVLNRAGARQIKLVDFGLAFVQEQSDMGRLTQELTLSGTPQYISPEQASASEIGPPADIYSLGIMFYLMICGQLPFTGTMPQLVAAHLYQAPMSLAERGFPNLPRALVHLIDDMLAKNPTVRPTAQKVADVLSGIDDQSPARAGVGVVRTETRGDTQKVGLPQVTQRERDQRALARPSAGTNPTASYDAESVMRKPHVAVIGPHDGDLLTALGMRSLLAVAYGTCQEARAASDAVECVFLLNDAVLSDALTLGAPVICARDRDDIDAAARLLAQGVSDSVMRPVDPSEAARKIGRAVGRARRNKTRRRV